MAGWREGACDEQEIIRAAHALVPQSSVQGQGGSGRAARGQDHGRALQGVRAAPHADQRMEAPAARSRGRRLWRVLNRKRVHSRIEKRTPEQAYWPLLPEPAVAA